MLMIECRGCNKKIAGKVARIYKKRCSDCFDIHMEELRNRRYLKTYGIDVQDYKDMLTRQRGFCAACGKAETRKDPKTTRPLILHIDHCHKSGRVRGLLCSSCNTALGLMQEDPLRIAGLLDYTVKQKEEDKKKIPVIRKQPPDRRKRVTIDYEQALKNIQALC